MFVMAVNMLSACVVSLLLIVLTAHTEGCLSYNHYDCCVWMCFVKYSSRLIAISYRNHLLFILFIAVSLCIIAPYRPKTWNKASATKYVAMYKYKLYEWHLSWERSGLLRLWETWLLVLATTSLSMLSTGDYQLHCVKGLPDMCSTERARHWLWEQYSIVCWT